MLSNVRPVLLGMFIYIKGVLYVLWVFFLKIQEYNLDRPISVSKYWPSPSFCCGGILYAGPGARGQIGHRHKESIVNKEGS